MSPSRRVDFEKAVAYLMRYGNQPLPALLELSPRELDLWARHVGDIIVAENEASRGKE